VTERVGRHCEFTLAEWVVEPSLNRLTSRTSTVHLRPRLMDLLVFLADHAGEVVAKEEILAAVWGQPFLAESVLSRSITELRQALGDDAAVPRYIETITKRGYRLVASCTQPPSTQHVEGTIDTACVLSYGGRRIALPEGPSVVGRAPDAAVRIDSMDVSRHHARIVVSCGVATIEDLGSRNGTRLNGVGITSVGVLSDGDIIGIGPAMLVFHVLGLPGSTVSAPPPDGDDDPGPT
jgi:DNA-binding winged helix-turn-helix (wHTH) protein